MLATNPTKPGISVDSLAESMESIIHDKSDDFIHLCCCNNAVALCGKKVKGWDTIVGYDPRPECKTCIRVAVNTKTCGAWFCRLRSRFRRY